MKRGFTLVELMITVVIIGILALLGLTAMQSAQNSSREATTKATIAKLHNIVMEKYESYRTRRVPIRLEPCPATHPDGTPYTQDEKRKWFIENQWKRLNAIRDLMRMELPDAKSDIFNGPITFTKHDSDARIEFPSWNLPEPALHKLFASNPPSGKYDGAQCLYMIVARGNPEAMEQFRQNEIGTTPDGKPCFIDGWGNPIMFLRWAPGYSKFNSDGTTNDSGMSEIQTGLPNDVILPDGTKKQGDHDPFDTQKVDGFAFHLIPLIYSSAGRKNTDGTPEYGIDLATGWNNGVGYVYAGNPYECMDLGQSMPSKGGKGNITNHLIEAR